MQTPVEEHFYLIEKKLILSLNYLQIIGLGFDL